MILTSMCPFSDTLGVFENQTPLGLYDYFVPPELAAENLSSHPRTAVRGYSRISLRDFLDLFSLQELIPDGEGISRQLAVSS